MQLYFIKATYTNNVYKIADFFTGSSYKLNAMKMLDVNFRPDDGLSSFITSKITLPDDSLIRDHTHIIVPEYEKIYRIVSIDYLNVGQYNVILDEDPLIANYQTMKDTDIIIMRTNDASSFRGVHDISDTTLKETVETKVIQSQSKTGKWALIFMQYNPNKVRYGLKFKNGFPDLQYETFANFTAITTKYPEVTTTTPSLYDYFQKIVYDVSGNGVYQCIYDGSKLFWNLYAQQAATGDVYFNTIDVIGGKLSESDVRNVVIALPFENCHVGLTGSDRILSFNNFVGPTDTGEVIDIKIVDDILLPITSLTYGGSGRNITKTYGSTGMWLVKIYNASSGGTEIANLQLFSLLSANKDIDLSPAFFSTTPVVTDAEPFKKYDLYVFGKKFQIPYYLTNSVRMLVAVNSGVINYTIYHSDKRYILASGSFTHSIRYQIDKLDEFYNQNPTYKDQFFTKMGVDAVKGVVGGAVAGSVVPGLGTIAGAGLGLASAGVDAGLSLLNLHFQEKGLRLKPDQIFGEISEVTMQLVNIFGIYWVKRTSENADLMKVEYDLRGFPTSRIASLDDLTAVATFFGTSKVVYGELKTVIKNEYVTAFINNKLKEGIVIV